jgi:hypothetical protein
VSAQMEKIERADCAIDGDEVNVRGAGEHDYRALDIGVLEAYPDVGAAQVGRVVDRLRGDEMLPAAVAVLLTDSFQTAGIVETGHGKFVAVYRDAVEFGDSPPGVFVVDEIVGEREHSAVEGKVSAEGCVLADSVHIMGNPVVALLSACGGASDGQCEDEKRVAEAAGKHRLLFDQTPFWRKSLYKIEFFLRGWPLGAADSRVLAENSSINSSFKQFDRFYD